MRLGRCNNTKIPILGKYTATMKNIEVETLVQFTAAEIVSQSVLGANTCKNSI